MMRRASLKCSILRVRKSTLPCETNGFGKALHSPFDLEISDGEGFVLVYSVTTRTTFERVEKFRDQVTRVKDTDDVPIVVVGNKCDAEDLREVPKDEGKANAERLGCQFIEASAKTSFNVEEPFYTVARMIRAERRGESAAVNEEPEPKKKKGKCNIL